MPSELIRALRRFLVSKQSITSLVGADTTYDFWIFRHKLGRQVEGTGQRAILIQRAESWRPNNEHNNMRFPRVRVDCYADPTRETPNKLPSAEDATERAVELWDAVFDILHDPAHVYQEWDDLRILGCMALGEPSIMKVPDSDTLMVAFGFYGVNLG